MLKERKNFLVPTDSNQIKALSKNIVCVCELSGTRCTNLDPRVKKVYTEWSLVVVKIKRKAPSNYSV